MMKIKDSLRCKKDKIKHLKPLKMKNNMIKKLKKLTRKLFESKKKQK